jgi:general secretion pathway protein K
LQALVYKLRLARSTPQNASATSDQGALSLQPLQPQRLEQLGWLGLSAASLTRLQPFITLLPVRTPVNLNTASAEVIYASLPNFTLAQAQRLVNLRQLMHFQSLADVGKVVAEANGQLSDTRHSVRTRFFEIRGRLRQDQLVVEQRAVVQRDELVVKVLWRQDGGATSVPPTLQ